MLRIPNPRSFELIVRVKCLRRFVATRFGCFFFSVRLSRFARMSNKPRKFRKIPKMNRRFGWNTNSGLELEIGKVSCEILFHPIYKVFQGKKKKIFLKIIYHVFRAYSDEYFRSRIHKYTKNSEKLAILGGERHRLFISKRKIHPFLQ